jgi:acyl phosphate:glycerol-3-phosphate acyltransferase
MLVSACLLLAAYLVGAIPFGYLIGRFHGVDLFQAGSGNIGATNAGRVLGRKIGILVFVLDFLKGALPVAVVVPLAEQFGAAEALGSANALRASSAALAFFGHLFPVYLGFRGGKGVATGAGAILVLVPIPAAIAIAAWLVAVLASRMVSLASLVAVSALALARLLLEPVPFAPDQLSITLFVLLGAAVVILKHRSNIRRLIAGTESRIGDFAMRETIVRGLHVLALGLWFGGAGFFNFASAPKIFQSFEAVVSGSPSDRTAHQDIARGLDSDQKKQLASALAGAAVGPIFPLYYALQTICCGVALATAMSWRKRPEAVHRRRVWILAIAMVAVLASLPLGSYVSELRVLRFDPDPAISAAAKAGFGPWHLASLLLSFVTVLLAGIALAMAAALPDRKVQIDTAGP